MNTHRTTLAATRLRSLAWDGDTLVDWVGGARHGLDGTVENLNVGSSYRFDSAVGLGRLGVSYEALGTKGRLLRDNGKRAKDAVHPLSVDILREIDRSYYHADDYFFPVTLFQLSDGRDVIAYRLREVGYHAGPGLGMQCRAKLVRAVTISFNGGVPAFKSAP
jgi:hypothetical protein